MKEDSGFGDLRRLKHPLAAIRRRHASTMKYYLSGDGLGFFHQPESRQKASLSSTATCITSLVRAGLWTPKQPWWDLTSAIADRLIKKPWESSKLEENNPFSVSFLVEAILVLQDAHPEYQNAEEHRNTLLKDAAPVLKAALEKGYVRIHPYPPSAFLTQLGYRALQKLQPSDQEQITRDVHQWSRTEINQQIALISARSRNADPLNLAYAVILAASTAPDAQTSPQNKQIFLHALELVFENQNKDGTWPTSRPLFHYPGVGNAYCFEYELLAQLVSCRPLRADLLAYISRLAQAAYLLESTSFDLDIEKPGTALGWPSGHHPQIEGPESWSTASVFHFVHVFDGLVGEAIRRSIFENLDSVYTPPTSPKRPGKDEFAKQLLDADLNLNNGTKLSLRETIADEFVYPIAREVFEVENGGSLSDTTPMSAIFFGPPGTAKTRLAKDISDYLGWPLLSIDPSYLVQEGLDRIQALANRLFSMLATTEQVVVLLDEFDEMGRDRLRNHELLSRFITTAMLPKLVSINTQRKIVFLLATNFVSGFDAAFRRGGRFDMLIQVMPPNVEAKLRHWKSLRASRNRLTAQEKEKADKLLADLTYLECEHLVAKIEKAGDNGEMLTILQRAQESCTLNQANAINGTIDPDSGPDDECKSDKTTWKKTCEIERKWIRIKDI